MALCELSESPSSVVYLSDAKSSYCPCPELVCVRAYFERSNRLELRLYLSLESSLWYYQGGRRTVLPPRLHGLTLVLTVMLCGLDEIRMEMSLMEMGAQLILPTTSFRTMNTTPYWCFKSPQYHILCSSFVVVSPNPVHLTSAKPRMSHR